MPLSKSRPAIDHFPKEQKPQQQESPQSGLADRYFAVFSFFLAFGKDAWQAQKNTPKIKMIDILWLGC